MLAVDTTYNQASLAIGNQAGAAGANFAPYLGQAMASRNGDLTRLAGLIMALARQVTGQTAQGEAVREAGAGNQATAGGYTRQQLETISEQAAAKYGLPPELVKAVVEAESSWRVQAESGAGAQGLMQLMPGTAREMGVADSFDPRQNIEGGSKYLASLMKRYQGDVKKALAAYNWGPGNLARGGSLPRETRNYLAKVTGLMADRTA